MRRPDDRRVPRDPPCCASGIAAREFGPRRRRLVRPPRARSGPAARSRAPRARRTSTRSSAETPPPAPAPARPAAPASSPRTPRPVLAVRPHLLEAPLDEEHVPLAVTSRAGRLVVGHVVEEVPRERLVSRIPEHRVHHDRRVADGDEPPARHRPGDREEHGATARRVGAMRAVLDLRGADLEDRGEIGMVDACRVVRDDARDVVSRPGESRPALRSRATHSPAATLRDARASAPAPSRSGSRARRPCRSRRGGRSAPPRARIARSSRRREFSAGG